ncbi:MAG: hypothetical protein KBT35_07990 [Firmicutes bacterium]|nr:hypothetical protein [Candidatus Colivicinus equi]
MANTTNAEEKKKFFTQDGYCITVPLSDDWIVKAFTRQTNKETNTYETNLFIGKESDHFLHEIVGDIFTTVPSENVKINFEVANMVISKYKEGYFNYHIESYNDELTAMSLGFEKVDELNGL